MPASPRDYFTPDVVGVAVSAHYPTCAIDYTLTSGQTVIQHIRGLASGSGSDTEACRGADTPVLAGDYVVGGFLPQRSTDVGRPLVLAGPDGEVDRWIAFAAHSGVRGCEYDMDLVGFSSPGAWLEGSVVHLTSGLVLPLAPNWQPPAEPSAFPLRGGDRVCVDADGRATSVFLASGGM